MILHVSLKHLVGLVGELPQTHYSSANHPSSVANAAAISASLQASPIKSGDSFLRSVVSPRASVVQLCYWA